MDQIAARFTGTAIKVTPGENNFGIFVTLERRGDEEYRCTHPTASISGFLRGSLYVSVQDHAFITCPSTGLKAILHYKDEPWLGKPRFLIDGIVFRYDSANDCYQTIGSVPDEAVVARLEGSWRERVSVSVPSAGGDLYTGTLVDLTGLQPCPKQCPPTSQQLEGESRKVWDPVTKLILAREYTRATRQKTDIEDQQRKKAAGRAASGEPFVPVYFTVPCDGRPGLTVAGEAMLRELASLPPLSFV